MTDALTRWLKSFHSGKLWLANLPSKETQRVYIPLFKRYCDVTGKNPDELIQLKMEGQKAVGTPKEFQAEDLHDLTISEMNATDSIKANISDAVRSFYKHNRRPLIEVKKFERPTPKRRTPKLEDIEDMANVVTYRRDEALIWFLATAPLREGTIPQLKWRDLKATGDKELPIVINIESERLKGKGIGKYKGLRQICFVNYFVVEKINHYRKEALAKGIELTGDTPVFMTYRENGNGNGTKPLSTSMIRTIFQNASLNAWHNLEEKRFSPHDFRSFVNTAMEKAKITENWRSVIMGHMPKGTKGKFYSDPSIAELKEQFKQALPYLIPEHKQKTPKQDLIKSAFEFQDVAWEFMKTQLEATIKESETLRALMKSAKDENTRKVLEVQLTMKLDEIQKLKQTLQKWEKGLTKTTKQTD